VHVLFVCTGNICRSPTAERLAVAFSARLQIPGFTASSAGTRAVIGHTIHHEAAPVLEKLGGDSSAFVARQINPRIASSADLVVTMTKAHRDAVLELAPHRLNRTFSLGEAASLISVFGASTIADLAAVRSHLGQRQIKEISDPIGQGPDVFWSVGSQIAELLHPLLALCSAVSVGSAAATDTKDRKGGP
jgi:protein-tyrosine phosphatase